MKPAIEPMNSSVFTCGSATYSASSAAMRSTVTVTSAWHSIAAPEISPSPWTAWASPNEISPPGTFARITIVAPMPLSGRSVLPRKSAPCTNEYRRSAAERDPDGAEERRGRDLDRAFARREQHLAVLDRADDGCRLEALLQRVAGHEPAEPL